MRDGEEFSRAFSFGRSCSKESAIANALVWRNNKLLSLPRPGNGRGSYRRAPQANKLSVKRAGITRYIHEDRRRAGNPKYVIFGVNYLGEQRQPRVKSFQAGRLDTISWAQEMHAALTAEAFRAEWEWCVDNNRPFDPTKYDGWANQDFTSFTPPS